MSLLEEYWPAGLGALALAAVSLGTYLGTGRLLGVSGMLARLLRPRETMRLARSERGLTDTEALARALEAATRAEFGGGCDAVPLPPPPGVTAAGRPLPASIPRPPWAALAVFAACTALGGLLSATLSGTLSFHWDLGPVHGRLFSEGPTSWVILLLGGVLVGFGTQMAGGCTSGHGLSGCSRLQPASLLATVCFFGTAVLLSLLLARIMA
ncbi:MAG: YeeE/YedE family protein [Myxococcales bacterium]|nr:YeeE/YedE family protein [Myxococcales bacterium]